MKVNHAQENRDKILQAKVEKAREEVIHSKKIHDKVKSLRSVEMK